MSLEQLCWLATAAYGIHIAEEYLLHWREWAHSISGVEVSRGYFWLMNSLVIVLGAVCATLAPTHPAIALAFPALMLINATFFHVGAFLWTRGRFSPGILTAVLLFYPIGIGCFKSASGAGLLTAGSVAESFGIAALLMAAPLLLLRARKKA